MTQDLMFEAATLAKAGRRSEARDLFLKLVERDDENELAWLWLSGLVDDLEDQIIAVENALLLNPDNAKAQQRLKQLQVRQALRQGQMTVPLPAQPMAAALDEHIPTKENSVTIKRSRPTTTLLRFTAGPVLLYLFVLLLHAAFDPGQHTPLIWLTPLLVLGGSWLASASRYVPQHHIFRWLNGRSGLQHTPLLRWGLWGLGALLVAAPLLAILLQSALRQLGEGGG